MRLCKLESIGRFYGSTALHYWCPRHRILWVQELDFLLPCAHREHLKQFEIRRDEPAFKKQIACA